MNIAASRPVQGEAGMQALGSAIATCLQPGDVLFLHGEMGMGKSVLARAIARVFGVQGAMPSPTFTILQSYEGTVPVKHFDLYRLEDPAEFFEAGLDEEMDEHSICLVEWPEMTDFAPKPRIDITITRGRSDDERLLSLTGTALSPERITALKNALKPLCKTTENGDIA